MAIISMLFGGVLGTVAALAGWLAFGLGLGSVLALYATLSLGLPCLVIAAGVLRGGLAGTKDAALPRT